MNRIVFDRSLYHLDAVKAAASAYAAHAEITVTSSGDTVIAEIAGGEDEDLERVSNSFCNLALQETIVLIRRTSGGE